MSIPVVYDTMIFLQAASRPDRVHATFRAMQDNRVTVHMSLEVQDVLSRDSIRAKFSALTPNAVSAFISNVLDRCKLLDPVPRSFAWAEHPDDDHVFNLAIYANAKYLVTWETRILKLSADTTPAAELLRRLAPDLAIVTPKEFANVLK